MALARRAAPIRLGLPRRKTKANFLRHFADEIDIVSRIPLLPPSFSRAGSRAGREGPFLQVFPPPPTCPPRRCDQFYEFPRPTPRRRTEQHRPRTKASDSILARMIEKNSRQAALARVHGGLSARQRERARRLCRRPARWGPLLRTTSPRQELRLRIPQPGKRAPCCGLARLHGNCPPVRVQESPVAEVAKCPRDADPSPEPRPAVVGPSRSIRKTNFPRGFPRQCRFGTVFFIRQFGSLEPLA